MKVEDSTSQEEEEEEGKQQGLGNQTRRKALGDENKVKEQED